MWKFLLINMMVVTSSECWDHTHMPYQYIETNNYDNVLRSTEAMVRPTKPLTRIKHSKENAVDVNLHNIEDLKADLQKLLIHAPKMYINSPTSTSEYVDLTYDKVIEKLINKHTRRKDLLNGAKKFDHNEEKTIGELRSNTDLRIGNYTVFDSNTLTDPTIEAYEFEKGYPFTALTTKAYDFENNNPSFDKRSVTISAKVTFVNKTNVSNTLINENLNLLSDIEVHTNSSREENINRVAKEVALELSRYSDNDTFVKDDNYTDIRPWFLIRRAGNDDEYETDTDDEKIGWVDWVVSWFIKKEKKRRKKKGPIDEELWRATHPDFVRLATASVVAKCYVCGIWTTGIPRSAHCSDGFAGEFLPVIPIDPRAKALVNQYKMYCRYIDMPRYYVNGSQPRSIYGRFTGGCSVRWIDLSGVYTQRVCRSTHYAMRGKHYVSKRMAKLEMALQELDNGCIVSPMPSLVPLSRGISLFARFHVCVCTGSWCNRARIIEPWAVIKFGVWIMVVALTFCLK